ncbi:neogenin-like [Mercenaria mercenaria]|uniref:neogenin-like n=1 Tax=Mercenaria mercenaria TaxID=6596 RepID=UPI00234F976F|nr:neogenin-like [Mercenaria mercenaria]
MGKKLKEENGPKCKKKVPSGLLLKVCCLYQIISLTSGANVPTFTNFYFSTEPRDVTGYKGKSLELPCSVVHADRGKPAINWYKDDHVIDFSTERRYRVADNGSLLISDITDRKSNTDTGSYQCAATWEGQTILSKKCTVQIAGIERNFDIEPEDAEVYLTDTAMFQCAIHSVPHANITWFKDDTLVTDRTNKFRTYPEGVLEIFNVEFSDLGTYHCSAEGVDRTRRSRDAKLSQKKAEIENEFQGVEPAFTLKPRDTSATMGSKVILFCGAFGLGSDMGRPRITCICKYMKNNRSVSIDGRTIDLNKDGRVTMIGGGNLQILDVRLGTSSNPDSDDATYMCRAENDVDSVDAEARLTVLVPPSFIHQPQNLFANEKSDASIPCQASGHPEPEITWFKNGEPIVPDDYFKISGIKNLSILGLIMSDTGFYQCFAENSVGSLQATIQLKVIQQNSQLPINPSTPSIYYHVHRSGAYSANSPEDVPSQPAKPRAAIVSTRFVTITWGVPERIGQSEIIAYTVRWQEIGSARERILNTSLQEANIMHLKPNTEYQFWVAAYNRYGASIVPAQLKIKTQEEDDVPSEPQNIVANPLSPTSIEVSWDPPAQTKGALTEYDLFYYVNGAVEEDEVQIEKSRTSYRLTGLEEYQEYSFRIVANNANGAGVSTEEVVARTFSDAPSDVPQNFTLETASSTSIVVRWQPPKPEHQNGKITGYKIRYKKKGAKKGLTVTTAGDRDLYALTDLKKDTIYQVRISAQTVNGSGPPTDWLFGKTYADDLDESHVPDMPDRLVVRPMTNSLMVQWVPNRRSKYLVRGYYLGYGKGIPDVYRQLFDANTFFYTIDNLQPASEYVVSIRAFNNMGEGQPRYETVFTLEETAEEPVTPMLPPIGLKALVLSPHTIVLTWTDNSLGKIQRITDNRYYTIRLTSIPGRGKYKYVNSTELVKHIDDLKPDTLYEFSVRVFKGRRKSTWSMAVSNRTQEAAPGSIPRDLTAIPEEGDSLSVTLTWQPPQKPNGQITGYLVFYTTDPTKDDLDWVVEGVLGEKLSMTITDLTADTVYYFKVQARNSKGYGPMSPTKIYRTPKIGTSTFPKRPLKPQDPVSSGAQEEKEQEKTEKGLSQNLMIIIIACVVGATCCIVVAVVTVFVCRKRDIAERNRRMASMYKGSPQKGKNVPNKGPGRGEGQPPDLWIDHDHLELKQMGRDERAESSISVPSTRRNSLSSVHTNNQAEVYQSGSEAEERLLPPSYHQLTNSQQRNIIRPKPLKLPVDAQSHQREPVVAVSAYPNGNIMSRYTPNVANRPPSPSEDSGVIPMRPVYPRTQYQMQYAAQGPPRVNAGDISNTSAHGYPVEYGYRLVPCTEEDEHCHPEVFDDQYMNRVGYGGFSTPSHHGSLTRRHKPRTPMTGIATPVKHMSSTDISNSQHHSGTFGRSGSPLRSFSVPEPPGSSKTSTPKHIVKPQQTAVPFKKAAPISSGPIKPRAMMAPMVSPKSAPDVLQTSKEEKDIEKSVSTEELTAEMANLEGLMKDLNAITQQDFEC